MDSLIGPPRVCRLHTALREQPRPRERVVDVGEPGWRCRNPGSSYPQLYDHHLLCSSALFSFVPLLTTIDLNSRGGETMHGDATTAGVKRTARDGDGCHAWLPLQDRDRDLAQQDRDVREMPSVWFPHDTRATKRILYACSAKRNLFAKLFHG